jgi:hypothetical protein
VESSASHSPASNGRRPEPNGSGPAIDWDDVDPNVRALVRALNTFDGLATISSCGGHEKPTSPVQWEAGTWQVAFEIDRSEDGWFALEFLAWLINRDAGRSGRRLLLVPDAVPPYLNYPGHCLFFRLEGYGEDPERLASYIERSRADCYVNPHDVQEAIESGDWE